MDGGNNHLGPALTVRQITGAWCQQAFKLGHDAILLAPNGMYFAVSQSNNDSE
jgi:hypothetical protein